MLVVNSIMRHIRILSGQSFILFTVYHRIHKEASRITQLARVGQFSLADVNDGLSQLVCRWFCNAFPLQFSSYVSIVQMRQKGVRKLIYNHCYKETVLPLMLEAAVTIAVMAVVAADNA